MESNTNAYVGMGGGETRWQSPPINTDAEVARLVAVGELPADVDSISDEDVEESSEESDETSGGDGVDAQFPLADGAGVSSGDSPDDNPEVIETPVLL